MPKRNRCRISSASSALLIKNTTTPPRSLLLLLVLLTIPAPSCSLLPGGKNINPLSGFANVYKWYNNNINNKENNQNKNDQINPLLFNKYLRKNFDYFYEEGNVMPPQPLPRAISLTPQESELLRSLRHVRDEYCPTTTIRIAGGWVRDKLLQLDTTTTSSSNSRSSHKAQDIDFVLSDQSGADFARLFYSYLVNNNNTSTITSAETSIIHLKQHQNHQTQSHHLQTASISVGNQLELDFCQLRQDVYKKDSNSRVPTVSKKNRVASIVEDAFRRDLTINSLYYNLQTNEVEDWTEMGVRDLQLRTISTPRNPKTTLLEDPLRILRAIRFATQLSFRLSPELKQITTARAKNDECGIVQQALHKKVSRERMGNEMDAIFLTNDPARGIKLLMETDLIKTMFPLEEDQLYFEGFLCLTKTQTLVSRAFTQIKDWEPSRRRWLWYAGFFKPMCDYYDRQEQNMTSLSSLSEKDSNGENNNSQKRGSKSKKGRRNESIVYQLLTQGLKRPTGDAESVETIIHGANRLQEYLTKEVKIPRNVSREQQIAELRWQAYQLLKPMGGLWKESLLLALASLERQDDITQVVRQYKQWVRLIVNVLSVDAALESWKPLLNGNEIQRDVLQGIDHGKGFKQVMAAQEEWQVKHGVFPTDIVDSDRDAYHKANIDALADHLIRTFPKYQHPG